MVYSKPPPISKAFEYGIKQINLLPVVCLVQILTVEAIIINNACIMHAYIVYYVLLRYAMFTRYIYVIN